MSVDERRRLEQLSEVLETLAELSHKINNPLTSLMGRAQLLETREKNDPYVQSSCQVIAESSRRIAEYVRELAQVVREGREHVSGCPDA
jgi:signal transduction histidine kinase